MSSLFDAVLQSDLGSTAGSQGHPFTSDIPSSRPQPMSESNGPMSDINAATDDPVTENASSTVIRRRNPYLRAPAPEADPTAVLLQRTFTDFLETFKEEPNPDQPSSQPPPSSLMFSDKYYIAQIIGMKKFGLSTLYVDYNHLLQADDPVLAKAVQDQYYRFHPYLTAALHQLIAKHVPDYYTAHHQVEQSSNANSSMMGAASSQAISDNPHIEEKLRSKTRHQQTDRMFAIAFYNLPLVSRLRQLRTAQIGQLLSISGTVTRTSEIRPELSHGTFICEACKTECPNVEQTFKYTEPTQCPNEMCGNRIGWRLDIGKSSFIDWQKVKLQESSHEIPTGSMPRTMDVILRGEMVDRARAGERCIFTGSLIVVPDVSQLGLPGVRPEAVRDDTAFRGGDVGGGGVSGLKSLGVRDLSYRLAFLACMVTPDTTTPGQRKNQQLSGQSENILASLNQSQDVENDDKAQEVLLQSLTPHEVADLQKLVHSGHIYSRIVDSLAPMIYGHRQIKKGLLLQLVGGVPKTTAQESMQLRGDINICIVGDPSTSKSQFLKYICALHPRAVYTSGKASSAAGLTASVVKDAETGEFTIEAGALMLANGGGICAIDEFDKMDISDQVAIHEAMEQQTISIAKAGIHTTLNARASILAAANPIGGRYNPKVPLRLNLNFSAPIMSRFDLFFVIRDDPNESVDRKLAQHIVDVHMLRDEAVEPELSTEQIQRYIRFARTFRPVFTKEAKTLLVEKYKELRSNDSQGGIGRSSYRITVRQLESLIRLSEAVAKVNCVEEIIPKFVQEAYDLLRESIVTVEKDDVEVDDDEAGDANDEDHEMGDRDREGDSPMAEGAEEQAPQPRARTKITFDKYMKILNIVVQRVNEDETQSGEGVEQEDLVLWYLEQIEQELHDEEDISRERALAAKVLKRMVKDNILMPIRGEGLVDPDEQGESASKTVYVMHPNCAADDIVLPDERKR